MKRRGSSKASIFALLAAILVAALPGRARGDWNVTTDASWRHDSNVGNAEYSDDVIADNIVAAKLSVFRVFPMENGLSVTADTDLSGEYYDRLDGLRNASLGGSLGIRKKWGLGPYAPWVRIGASVAHTDYSDDYRNASIYRTTLGAGRRLNERWNLAIEYAFEHRSAATLPEDVPGISGDAFSQTSHTLNAAVQFTCTENLYLSVGLLLRRGDVISTTFDESRVPSSIRAYAEDPAFGPDAYAYRLEGTSFGFRAGISYAPAPHHLLSFAFERIDTHLTGDDTYTKSVPEVRWDYSF